MILPEQLPELRRMIRASAARDSRLLAELVRQARELAQDVRPIRPRAATAVALTATDGGNNAVAFNPFSLQIVRVVDSQGKELFLDVVSPGTDIGELSRRHLAERTALGQLMTDLGVSELRDLSRVMTGRSADWVNAYRDLCEWATLYDLVCNHDFASDTLVVRDGLLRATTFRGDMLPRLGRLMRAAIESQARRNRRRVWVAGLAKKTKVLDHYRLAMSLAGIFDHGTPCFVAVPTDMQDSVYRSHQEYVRDADDDAASENIGRMYFVRFGARPGIRSGPPTCSPGRPLTRRRSSGTCKRTPRRGSPSPSTRSACSRRTRTPASPTWTWTSSKTASSTRCETWWARTRRTSWTRCG
jgi:hypothetical protein